MSVKRRIQRTVLRHTTFESRVFSGKCRYCGKNVNVDALMSTATHEISMCPRFRAAMRTYRARRHRALFNRNALLDLFEPGSYSKKPEGDWLLIERHEIIGCEVIGR